MDNEIAVKAAAECKELPILLMNISLPTTTDNKGEVVEIIGILEVSE